VVAVVKKLVGSIQSGVPCMFQEPMNLFYCGKDEKEGRWKYKVLMLIGCYGDWAERVDIASINKRGVDQSLADELGWNEIILVERKCW
jgi:hypothetical protein